MSNSHLQFNYEKLKFQFSGFHVWERGPLRRETAANSQTMSSPGYRPGRFGQIHSQKQRQGDVHPFDAGAAKRSCILSDTEGKKQKLFSYQKPRSLVHQNADFSMLEQCKFAKLLLLFITLQVSSSSWSKIMLELGGINNEPKSVHLAASNSFSIPKEEE